jgi:hypothetical protein
MQKMFTWLKVILALGPLNVFRNIIYRLKLKVGLIAKSTPIGKIIRGPLFTSELQADTALDVSLNVKIKTVKDADALVNGKFKLFFHSEYLLGSPPLWFHHKEDVFNGHWSESPVNKHINKDIKLTWDASRFHWLQQLACAYKTTNNQIYLESINLWFDNWNKINGVNSGVNWACGQECAIRVVHVLNSTFILDQVQVNSIVLIEFVVAHCLRIEPTISYAISQDNNHGTSESAALFICGAWLLKQPQLPSDTRILAERFVKKGRLILEERVSKLFLADGGFSMYSTNYHRVVLNTLIIVEFWRRELLQKKFTDEYIKTCQSATKWLYELVDEISGDTLNLGANDGSNPFLIQSSDYRDFRPTIQLAAVLFCKVKLYCEDSLINEPLNWLRIQHSSIRYKVVEQRSLLLPESGIAILRSNDVSSIRSSVFVKFPNYDFRPNQVDLMHLDLWHKGVNIFRDAGSYSYNCDVSLMEYYSSLKAHNTVEIDQSEPMPRLGRFLLGDWTKMSSIKSIITSGSSITWAGSYEIKSNITHTRQVSFSEKRWAVVDLVDGAAKNIMLRWRLNPGKWQLKNNELVFNGVRIVVEIKDGQKMNLEIVQGLESRYYNSSQTVPILEVKVSGQTAKIVTYIYIESD